LNIDWLEWLGYLASLIVLISLLMSSILKLRWINLVGSSIFSLYGFLIGALPVGFMNLGIAIINVYYLTRIYSSSKEYFKMLEIESNTEYFKYFLDFYKEEIRKFSDKTAFNVNDMTVSFFILRNMVPAGLFLASKHDEKTLKIELDFVIPEYRDFKTGTYIFQDRKEYFLERGYTRFISYSDIEGHQKYLTRVGFEEKTDDKGNKFYEKTIK
jgi:hypothetical protein